jgi:hypothetical protein
MDQLLLLVSQTTLPFRILKEVQGLNFKIHQTKLEC